MNLYSLAGLAFIGGLFIGFAFQFFLNAWLDWRGRMDMEGECVIASVDDDDEDQIFRVHRCSTCHKLFRCLPCTEAFKKNGDLYARGVHRANGTVVNPAHYCCEECNAKTQKG